MLEISLIFFTREYKHLRAEEQATLNIKAISSTLATRCIHFVYIVTNKTSAQWVDHSFNRAQQKSERGADPPLLTGGYHYRRGGLFGQAGGSIIIQVLRGERTIW